MKRMLYLRRLERLRKKYGRENIIYVDESGFKKYSCRRHGWTRRGQIIYGDVSGNNRKATNLIMAQREGRWLAPETFDGTCNALRFNEWLEHKLIPLLSNKSVIVIDNAAFHKKKQIATILKKRGHLLLPLPPYSPDFNPIENSFGTIKKIREFSPPDTPILDIIKSSDSYWE